MRAAPLPKTVTPRRLLAVLLALPLLVAAVLLPSGTASAAAAPIAQCNGIMNVGGQTARCSVTVVNTLNVATGIGSSTVTAQVCTGAIGAATCGTPVTSTFQDVVATVTQCNGSGSGGGGEVACTVDITNNITGGATPTAATVNQCIGSADGSGTKTCNPLGSTSGATVTQCNGSGNGGGSTVTCTVAPASTQSASLRITVDQCNGSANGGGSLVTCRSTVTNNAVTAPAPTSSATPSTSATPSPSTTPTSTPSPTASTTPTARPTSTPSATPSASATPVTARPTPPTSLPGVTPTPVTPGGNVGTGTGAGTPGAAGPPVAAPGVPAVPTTSPSLPRTGSDEAVLSALGALTVALGIGMCLVAREPRGQHVRTR